MLKRIFRIIYIALKFILREFYRATRYVPGTRSFKNRVRVISILSTPISYIEMSKDIFGMKTRDLAISRLKECSAFHTHWSINKHETLNCYEGIAYLTIFLTTPLCIMMGFGDYLHYNALQKVFGSIFTIIFCIVLFLPTIELASKDDSGFLDAYTLIYSIVLKYILVWISIYLNEHTTYFYIEYITHFSARFLEGSVIFEYLVLIFLIIEKGILIYPRSRAEAENLIIIESLLFYNDMSKTEKVFCNPQLRNLQISRLSRISQLISCSSFRYISGQSKNINDWHLYQCQQWSYAIEQKKRTLMSPKQSDSTVLKEWARRQLISVCLGRWDELDKTPPEITKDVSAITKMLDVIGAIFIALLPPVLLCLVQSYFKKVSIPDAYMFMAGAWTIFILVSRVDPKIGEKISAFKQAFDNLPSLKGKD